MTTGKLLTATLLTLAALVSTNQAASPVRVQLNCLSLNVQTTSPKIGGIRYIHSVGATDDISLANGEMRLTPPDTINVPEIPTDHEGAFFYYDGQFNETYTLPFTVDFPPADENTNHIPDLYEFDRTVYGRTTGLYQDPLGDVGTFTADWEKDQGSAGAVVRIQYDFDVPYNIRFSHTFEVFQYSGQFTPGTPGPDGTASAEITLEREGAFGTIAGTLRYKMEAGKLTILSSTTLATEQGSPFQLSADAPSTLADSKIYTLLNIVDGLPNNDPAQADFKEWSLMLTDPNDADNDGTPDLFEGAPAVGGRAPQLEIARIPNGIRLTIHADIGVPYTLEDTAAIFPAAWSHPTTITLPTDPHIIDLPAPSGPTYWRMRIP